MLRRELHVLVALPCFAVAAVCALGAESKVALPEKITSLEGINEYRLANGLRVLLFPDQSKPTVTVNVTYFVGSRHEGYGETGMAHLLEHLVFKGTPSHPDIWKALQNHGAQFNGSTWLDRTNYFETLAASDENLEFALHMEADRMVNSHIAQKDLDSEMTVVRNEFEMGENDPLGVLSERVMSAAYLWHNYGKSTIGSREDIERVPIDRLQAFYRKYYQPDNAILVVAGKFDETKTLAKINDRFGAIAKPARVLEPTYTVEPTQDGEREVVLRRVGDVQGLSVVYHTPAGAHDDAAAVDVMCSVLTADQTGRLYKALVEPQLATRVSAFTVPLHDPGFVEISVEVRKDKAIDGIRKTLLDVTEGLGKTEISSAEVERAKNEFARRFDLMLNDSGRVGIRLSESAAAGDWRLMFLYRDRMKKVTQADVQRVAAAYLKSSNRTLGTFIPTPAPDRSTIPATPDIVALLRDYKGAGELVKGEEFDATPANIESRTKRAALANGMKLAMVPKKTRGERVNGNITLHFGSEADLKGRVDAASFLPQMLMMGTSKHSRRELQDELDKLKATVRISEGGGMGGGGRFARSGGSGPGTIMVTLETIRPNLPAVLKLVVEVLRESSFPEVEFEKQRKEALASLEQQLSEPMALAPVELRRRLTPYPKGDVRYINTIPETIENFNAIKLDEIKAVYKDLLGASHAEAAFVGDFDAAEIQGILEASLGQWKSPKPFQRVAMPFKEVSPDTAMIKTPDKANALFTLGSNIAIKDDAPEYPALFMANYILGGSSNSRLINRIRQKEGLSYGVNSNLQASPFEASAAIVIGGIAAPENAQKAIAAAQEELDKLAKDGVPADELDSARKGFLEDLKVTLSNDAQLTMQISRNLYLDRTMKFLEDRLAKIEKLTPEAVGQAARKHFDANRLTIVAAGDLDKKPPATPAPTPAPETKPGS